jgi:hypothetical protein
MRGPDEHVRCRREWTRDITLLTRQKTASEDDMLMSTLRLFLGSLLCLVVAGCADWWSNNITSYPPKVTIVPQEKLWLQWIRFQNPPKDRTDANDRTSSPAAVLIDTSWAAAFAEVAKHLHGWHPDYCVMWKARLEVYVDRDLEPFLGGVDSLKSAFWKSYLHNVYYDDIAETPTAQSDKAIKDLITTILKYQNDLLDESSKAFSLRTSMIDALFRGENPFQPENPPSIAIAELPLVAKLKEQLHILERSVPKCDDDANKLPINLQKDTMKEQNDKDRPSTDTFPDKSRVNQFFLTRLLTAIDEDHSGLLVDIDPERNPEAGKLRKGIAKWQKQHESCCRALTVSKINSASLSPSVKRLDPPIRSPKQALFLKTAGPGQQAFVELARALFHDTPCDSKLSKKECREAQLETVNQLIKLLDDPEKSFELKDFDERQAFELILSSVLNSPDTGNRFEYLTTYLYFYPYPYPSNGKIVLEKEFWARFRSAQIVKVAAERKRALETALDRAWKDMRVQIENVETTVQRSAHEIAEISRESDQGFEVKGEPSIELGGTVKGKLDSLIDVSSKLKTTVSERLLRELDRRSGWLNSSRNLLRITQRGLDALNIAGMLKEKVFLHVPQSVTSIPYLESRKEELGIRNVGQPIYSAVNAVAISLAVIREPYKFKRAAAEKYGLPDSSDAYYVVSVSQPAKLTLWKWDRTFNGLRTDVLDVAEAAPRKVDSGPLLHFFDASTGLQDRLLTVTYEEKVIKDLRSGIYSLLNSSPGQLDKVRCNRTGKDEFYLTITMGKSSLEKLWIGKESPNGETRGFDGTENDTLKRLKVSSNCSAKWRP